MRAKKAVLRAAATLGVAALGFAVGAGPAFAANGTAYSKAELVSGNLLGNPIVDPVVEEYDPATGKPGGTIQQPSVNIGDIVKLDLVGLGVSATGDADAGKSQAAVNIADASLSVGLPVVGTKLTIKEAALDTVCTADGGKVSGNATVASVAVKVTQDSPFGPITLADVSVPVGTSPNFGISLNKILGNVPGLGGVDLGEVLLNKQVVANGRITVTGVSAQVLGTGVELGKVTCGPNVPTPEVPVVHPAALGGAAALGIAALAGFGIVRHRRRTN